MDQGPLGPMGQGLGPGLGPWTGPGPKLPRAWPNPDPALRPRGGAARGQDPNPEWILTPRCAPEGEQRGVRIQIQSGYC